LNDDIKVDIKEPCLCIGFR